jgi:hypothetical protein
VTGPFSDQRYLVGEAVRRLRVTLLPNCLGSARGKVIDHTGATAEEHAGKTAAFILTAGRSSPSNGGLYVVYE